MSVQRGFTIIELMVTVAVAAILLALAIPSFTGFMARARLEGVANELVADLVYARSLATTQKSDISTSTPIGFHNISLVTSNDGKSYAISGDGVGQLKVVTLDSRLSLSGSTTVTFDSFRGFSSAGSISVSSSETPATFEVSVDVMGVAKICTDDSGMNNRKYPPCQ